MSTRTFQPYSAESDVLPWQGWLEDEDGNTVAFVDLVGRVYEMVGHFDVETSVAVRTGAWNAVRDAVAAAESLPAETSKTDYWPTSNLACVVSLAMRSARRLLRKSTDPEARRIRGAITTLEGVFAVANEFSIGEVSPPPDEASDTAEPS